MNTLTPTCSRSLIFQLVPKPNLIFIALIIMLLTTITGCASLDDTLMRIGSWRQNATQIESQLNEDLTSLESQRAIIDDTSPDAPFIDAAIVQARAKIQTLQAAIAQADLVIAEAQNPTDSLTLAVDSLSPWIPAPAQGPLVLGAALIATFVRSQKLKNNAASIIQSIDHALNKDPVFKDRFDLHADSIRTIQTPGARNMIRSAQQKRSAINPASILN